MGDYLGYQRFQPTEEQLADLYVGKLPEELTLMQNEYIIVDDAEGNVIDYFQQTASGLSRVLPKGFNTKYSGKVRPRNPQQVLAVDMLNNSDVTIKIYILYKMLLNQAN